MVIEQEARLRMLSLSRAGQRASWLSLPRFLPHTMLLSESQVGRIPDAPRNSIVVHFPWFKSVSPCCHTCSQVIHISQPLQHIQHLISIPRPEQPLSFTMLSNIASRRFANIITQRAEVTLAGSRRSYHENIVEHYENPRNVGSLDKNSDDVGTVSLITVTNSVRLLL